MTLLYIDDDEDDVRFLFDAMRSIDATCKCIMASNGKQGLSILKNFLPDYIFLDINMPEMNGEEVLRLIRADKKLDDVMIVMFTTYLDHEAIKKYKANGATHCLTKPASYAMLRKSLEKIFGER